MYRSKKDVDKHVDNLISKLSVKEFKTRAYSVARLYFEVGDFASCQRYVEQYLTQKDNNAAAYKLLGQALQKLGQKEKALEQYKISLDIDPTQTSTILDICELLADDEIVIDPGRAKYWCEKAEATFPRHPVTFRLRERLVTISNPDPEALVKLLIAEIAVRPKDAVLHCRLLKHYLNTNQIKEAFEHSSEIEFGNQLFMNNFTWYDTVAEIVKNNHLNATEWQYQLLLLTVRERLCVLSLSETHNGTSQRKSLIESTELLHAYDQAIEKVAKIGAPSGFGDFHSALLQHHRGQIVLHAATLLLKKAKKDQLSWRDATRTAAPLMLLAWQTVPLDTNVNWLCHAPERQQTSVRRWYTEGSYRCSQSGHYLLANIQDKSQSFLDRISQTCSGTHWRDKLYEKVLNNRDHLAKIKTSYFASNAFNAPVLRLPRRVEVEAYDVDAQREYPNSLHHFVWMLLNYKNYAHFKCTLFDMLTPTAGNCGPETLNKLDVHAFLYFASITAHQQKSHEMAFTLSDKPSVVPANITDLQCSLSQMKWWDCAYKFSQNELGTELTDIRVTLSRGIEVVRCIDNHGLDPELLCLTARIFSEKAKLTKSADEKSKLEVRAGHYYSLALPLLEKLKSKIIIKIPEKRLFDYTHKELGSKELNALIEESKLYVAINCLNDSEYDKAIELLTNLKSVEAYFHLSQAYKRLALDEYNAEASKSKFTTLLIKAKTFAYKALDGVKDSDLNKDHPLYSEIQQQIEEIEKYVIKVDPDLSGNNYDVDGKYSSDENISCAGSEYVSLRNNHHMLRNVSSTPKHPATNSMLTHYRTATDSQMLDNTRADPQFLEKIESQIKNFQKQLADDFMEQTKSWFEENRRLGNQIMSTIQSDIQNTTDQFKLLKISVDKVKDQIDECRNECKDVGDLKKQIADLRKEVNKLKKVSSEQTIDESALYNLDDDYRTNESTSSFATQLPFQASQVMPPFNQRLVPPFPVPPNPYLYNQGLYNLYNQYSQFSQNAPIPGAPPLFDPTKFGYPGVYPTPDQMYMDVANLVAPSVPPAPTVPAASTISAAVPPMSSGPSTATSAAPTKSSMVEKEILRSLPVNVVITSSDPLPTSTSAPAPILSVTIPQKHIKGTPHNYQIQLPSTNETNVGSPPVFSFPTSGKTGFATTASSVVHWNQNSIFKTSQSSYTTSPASNTISISAVSDSINKNVADGHKTTVPNTNLNKSRTLSERSNTSVENYDPCPDFKPIIPLPDEVKVTTGEEDETVIFCSRAKLFRFVDKQWKERGLGEMKLLKHKLTGKVRILMRREQIHKICANHIITPEIEIKPMKNEAKAYFWVANDFADETVVLEKFCVRFKTAATALKFYETFEKARKEAEDSSSPVKPLGPNTVKEENKNEKTQNQKGLALTTTPMKSTPTSRDTQSKTQFGGFTFTSTPTLKPVIDNSVPDVTPTEPVTSKFNIFGNLNFKSTTSSPFTSLLGVTASPLVSSPVTSASIASKQETTNKLNTSDTVEEFEPNVEFKPVIPLPALVDLKTGEEEESILFEHRAKLLRFDANSKEWKERGLGNVKLLVHKDNTQKVRLLMRREQIMKVCCNHGITKDMLFQKMPNMDKAVTWCAKDYSEGELVSETFCLRFKTVQTCDDFITAIKNVQSKIKDESKAAKEEQNAAKQSNQIGFGDKFKPKPDSWECTACYTNNLDSFGKCACCEQPRPGSGDTKIKPSPRSPTGFGDKFKPKPGSWECSACLVRNDASVDYCTACNNPKNPSIPKKETSLLSDNAPKFRFGIPAQTTNVTQKKEAAPVSTTGSNLGWGDKFKPKEGSWECKECFVRNDGFNDKCSACTSPRDGNAAKNQSGTFVNVSSTPSGPKFTFGIPPATNVVQPKSEQQSTNSIFDGTGAHKFVFGIPSDKQQQSQTAALPFAQQTSIPGNTISKTGSDGPLNLTSNKDPSTPSKPALLPTPNIEKTTFGDKDTHATFDFVFKPKSPPKGKSPAKSSKADGDESDADEYASEDEGHHIHFSPVIPLPDKVEVVTGEENETGLYEHRAKLFRFISGEWKERGIGIVKILKHKETGKLRVVMRREQVLKICLNHALTSEITYTAKDDKTWLFAANDFSEGELSLQQFCLRFKTKEIALDFKNAIENAKQGKPILTTQKEANKNDNDSDDVVFVGEIQATEEEKQKAKQLMLPENFFTYKNKDPCKGCRGCKDDDKTDATSKPSTPASSTTADVPEITDVYTPAKTTVSTFQSPMNSFYGTPANFDKSADASIFRTPLGSLGSNTNSASPATPTNTSSDKNNTNKENMYAQMNIFGGSTHTNLFGTPNSSPASIFAAAESQSFAGSKSSILAAPKLSTLNTSANENQSPEPKSIFGIDATKSIFNENNSIFANANTGFSASKPVFGFESDKKVDDPRLLCGASELTKRDTISTPSISDNNTKPAASIFGGDGPKSSLFGGPASGNIFQSAATEQKAGTGLFASAAAKFGAIPAPQQGFGTGTSIFGAGNQQPTWTLGAAAEQKPDVTKIEQPKEETKETPQPETESAVKDTLFKVDNSLSFAALSSTGGATVFKAQKKTDFQWEGAGQQLFTSAQKAAARENDKSKNDSGADESAAGADEEYDPHYEPIVPLPDKIVVTTGEEDEEKLFGERAKLYRYDEKSHEWKERGVGEMKILYHPERQTYRLLLRREQVHKAVLNMLILMDLELLPMKNSDRAWTWAGRNFAETPQGEQETLAVRFKSVDLATGFKNKVVECTRKLQAAAAQAIKEEKEPEKPAGVAPLRLPKHLESSARADTELSAKVQEHTQTVPVAQFSFGQVTSSQDTSNGLQNKTNDVFKQVHFEDSQGDHGENDDGEDEDQEYYDHNEDYDAYYNEEEEETAAYYECIGEVEVRTGGHNQPVHTQCPRAHMQVLFDQEIYSPKILVTDSDTGEILADMLIHTDTEFQMSGDSCTWSGTDYTSNDPVDKTVTVHFSDSDTALQFYDSCETSKGATYSSTDPES